MPEFEDIGKTAETSGRVPQIETVVRNEQSSPFQARREGSTWRLYVNRNQFLSRGFIPVEVDGAVYLEEERLASQVSVDSIGELNGLKHWQQTGRDPQTAAYKNLFERVSALKTLEKKDQAKAEAARRYLKKVAARPVAQGYPDQLLQGILHKALSDETSPQAEIVANVLSNLERKEAIEDRQVSTLDALSSPGLSLDAKATWFESRFLPRLEFLQRQEEAKRIQETETPQQIEKDQKEELEKQQSQEPPTPPDSQDEFEQHRGKETKGEAIPIFTIDPFHPGYWETESYSDINEGTGRLLKSDTTKKPISSIAEQGEIICVIEGSSGTNFFSLPLSTDLVPDQESVNNLKELNMDVSEDQEGHIFIKSPVNQDYEIKLARTLEKNPQPEISQDNQTVESNLPAEITAKIKEISGLPVDSLEKASLWHDFIRSYFKYPQDEQVEQMYVNANANSGRRLSAMIQGKLLDCHLAREFFLGGLRRLNLPDIEWRAVNGHYLSSKQKDGTGHLNSGTGHAWVKARLYGSNEWIIFDATPEGDPVKEGEGTMSDFSNSQQDLISEEDLKQMEKELGGGSDKPKYIDPQEEYLMEFADEAGISADEARRILNTLKQVDELKDRSGRNILQLVKEQFDRIIQTYTKERVENLGNVEMSRGRELADPVEAHLDIKTRSLDPRGFSKQTITEEQEELYGGFDIEIIGDGSGSMSETVGGIVKYLAQQKMSYLLHRGAHYFAQEAQKRRLRLITPLAIRSSQYIFRGNNIEEIKSLSSEFTPSQMLALWKRSAENIGGGTPAHLGLQAVLDNIPPEEVELLKDKKLLKIVALISDGGYDNPQAVASLKRELEEMNVVVAEFQITDGRSLEDLPENVAQEVIEAARKLIPEKVKK